MPANQLAFQFFEESTERILPKPFLKWAGGKSQLLDQLTPFFPKHFQIYYEPFVGSGAVFWHLFSLKEKEGIHFNSAKLTDSNEELINCYQVVRDSIDQLIELLVRHRVQHGKAYYYRVRSLDVSNLSPLERAARFIYLNKTCYNGLYRVNRSGQFNVPMGSYKTPRIFDADELVKTSQALQNADIQVADFHKILDWAEEGDFIYFDPPYVPLSKTSSFTSYTKNPFGRKEQKELADIFHCLSRRGCKLMLSNSWTKSTLNLYEGFNCIEVKASRVINSNSEGRGKISELLVINYTPKG